MLNLIPDGEKQAIFNEDTPSVVYNSKLCKVISKTGAP
jgi:hypothetical protein